MIPKVSLLASLRTRLLLLVLLAIIPMALLLLYNALKDRQDASEQVRRDAEVLVRQTADHQSQLTEGSRQLLASLAGLAASVDVRNLNPITCQPALRLLISELSFYSNVGIATVDGNVVCSAVSFNGPINVAETEWFKRVTQTRRFVMGTYEPDKIIGMNSVGFAYPVPSLTGGLNAVVFLSVESAWFGQALNPELLTSGATFTLYDRNGTVVVSHPDPDEVLAGSNFRNAQDFQMATSSGGGVAELEGLDGVERLYAYTPIGEADPAFFASAGFTEEEAFAGVSADLRRNLLILAIFGGAALAATYLANEWLMIRPVRQLIEVTKQISGGDLAARVHLSKAQGEIGMLGQAFDDMSASLEIRESLRLQAEARLKESNAQLEETVAELKRSNADLEQFAYVASHDLQEPLRMVSSYTQLLSRRYRDKLDQDADEFIDFAVDGAQRMQTLINDLLAFSRVNTRRRALAPVEMEKVLKDVKTDLSLQIDDAGAVITHDNLPAVMGDETQLHQVLQNLIGNGIKFHGKETPAIHISAKPEARFWVFSVADNGIGIPPEQSERIFVIFQRLHRRTEYSGTGIGLAITKRIVERHGGRIWVESTPDEGATFYFTLQSVTNQTLRSSGQEDKRAA